MAKQLYLANTYPWEEVQKFEEAKLKVGGPLYDGLGLAGLTKLPDVPFIFASSPRFPRGFVQPRPAHDLRDEAPGTHPYIVNEAEFVGCPTSLIASGQLSAGQTSEQLPAGSEETEGNFDVWKPKPTPPPPPTSYWYQPARQKAPHEHEEYEMYGSCVANFKDFLAHWDKLWSSEAQYLRAKRIYGETHSASYYPQETPGIPMIGRHLDYRMTIQQVMDLQPNLVWQEELQLRFAVIHAYLDLRPTGDRDAVGIAEILQWTAGLLKFNMIIKVYRLYNMVKRS